MATAKFIGLTSGKRQARVEFLFPESKICPQTTRCYYLGELTAAAHRDAWMAPVLAAAKAAGLK